MAKANLVLPDGTKVDIEGTADEVAVVLAKFSGSEPSGSGRVTAKRKAKKKKAKTPSGAGGATKNKKALHHLLRN